MLTRSYFHRYRQLPFITFSWPVGVDILEHFSHQGRLCFIIIFIIFIIIIIIKLNQGNKSNTRSIHSLQASPAETSITPLVAEDSRVGWTLATGSLNIHGLFCNHFHFIYSVLVWLFHRHLLPKARGNGAGPFLLKGTQTTSKGGRKAKRTHAHLEVRAFDQWGEGWLFMQWRRRVTAGNPISLWKVCFHFFHVAGGSTISLVLLGHCLENCELSECHPALHRARVSLEGPGGVAKAGSHCSQVPRWNTLISTDQGKTGHPRLAQQEGALGLCRLCHPLPAKPDRPESQGRLSSRTPHDLDPS